MEKESSLKRFFKSERVLNVVTAVVFLIVFIIASYIIGHNVGHSRGVSDQKKLQLADTKGKLQNAQNRLDKVNKDLSANQDKFDKLQALSDKKDELQNTIDGDNSELKSLESDIKDAKDNLSTLTGQVQEAESAPKTLEAGTFTVGEDIPAGRYKATPIGRGSNFFVYGADGSEIVNTILGSPEAYGVSSYTFAVEDGDIIKTEAAAKLTPVK